MGQSALHAAGVSRATPYFNAYAREGCISLLQDALPARMAG
jgi:hypothetical protein